MDYKIKSYSSDIAFCGKEGCKDYECSRNMEGEDFKRWLPNMYRYSVANFTEADCYKEKE